MVGDVRNCPDSTVEIIVEGESGKLTEFVKKVEQGPSLARVQHLDVLEIPARGKYRSFLVEGW